MSAAERAGKFFLSCVEDERLLQEMQKLVEECLAEGVSEAEFVHRATRLLDELIDPATGRPYHDPEAIQELPYDERIKRDRDVSVLDSAARLKLIFRTQNALAQGVKQWLRDSRPDRLERYPAWRFVRQPGAKTKRTDHVLHEEDVRLITDMPYWLARNDPSFGGFNNPFPPFGYNSWMRVERVSRAEAEQLGLLQPGEPITIPPEMEALAQVVRGQTVDQSNSASIDSLPPDAQKRVKERCEEAGLTLEPSPDGKSLTARVNDASDDDAEVMLDIIDLVGEEEAKDVIDFLFSARAFNL